MWSYLGRQVYIFWHFYNIRFPNLSAVTHVFFKCIFVRTDYKNIILIQLLEYFFILLWTHLHHLLPYWSWDIPPAVATRNKEYQPVSKYRVWCFYYLGKLPLHNVGKFAFMASRDKIKPHLPDSFKGRYEKRTWNSWLHRAEMWVAQGLSEALRNVLRL